MKRSNLVTLIAAALGVAIAAGAALLYRAFQKQKQVAVRELAANGLKVHTTQGLVEYAALGDGPPVLMLHGGGGGYDQGLLFSPAESGFQFIAPSRPGYLGTPLETGASYEAQADSYAALLDTLGIERVGVIGISGGGPSAIQFALRHPQRCWALVLGSAVSKTLAFYPAEMQFLVEKVMPFSDFLPWLFLTTPLLDVFIDYRTRSQIKADMAKRQQMRAVMRSMFPISLRIQGALNDLERTAQIPDYPLEKITAPTLVVHGESDSIVPFDHGQWSAAKIPGARFLPLPEADHFALITHAELTMPVVLGFLAKHAPEE